MRLRLLLAFGLIVLVTVAGILLIARLGIASEVQNFMFRGGATGNEGLVVTLENYFAAQQSWQGADALLANRGAGHGAGSGGRGQGMGAGQGGAGAGQRLILADAGGRILYDTANLASAAAGILSPCPVAGCDPASPGW